METLKGWWPENVWEIPTEGTIVIKCTYLPSYNFLIISEKEIRYIIPLYNSIQSNVLAL